MRSLGGSSLSASSISVRLTLRPPRVLSGNGFSRCSLLVEGHALAQLVHQGAVDAAAIRLLGLAEGADEGTLRDLFRLNLVPHHVVGDGVGPVLMGLVDVALPVFERSLGHLALHDPARSLGRKISFKVQQACPRLWDSVSRFAALCGVRNQILKLGWPSIPLPSSDVM